MSAHSAAAIFIGWQAFAVSGRTDLVRRATTSLAAFRDAGMLVFHAQLLSLPTSTSGSWHALQEREEDLRFPLIGSPEAEIVRECRPLQKEPVVESYRASVFLDTRLPLLLRSNAVRNVILFGPGLHTSILSSAVTAACLDFEVAVPLPEPGETTSVDQAAIEILETWASGLSEVELGDFLREHEA